MFQHQKQLKGLHRELRRSVIPGVSALTFAFACSSSSDTEQNKVQAAGGSADAFVPGSGGQVAGAGGYGVGGALGSLGGSGLAAAGATAMGGNLSSSAGGAVLGIGGGISSGGAPSLMTGGSPNSGGVDGGSGGNNSTVNESGGLVPGTRNYNCDPPTGDMPELQLTPYVTSGLDLPIFVTHAPNETDRLFVLEQAGKIKVVKNGVVNDSAFLDIVARVSTDPWEQGLLGLAFHPEFSQNGLFYIHYNIVGDTEYPDNANILAEYKVSANNPDVADPISERVLLSLDTDRTGEYLGYHNGGSIFFGLDSELFIALGDGAGRGPGEAANNSQDLSSLRGTLSRINPEESGGEPYTIPAGNFAETTPMTNGMLVAPEIWSYGLRNPYRTNMDACTGDIYFGDVGHFDWEEVDVEPARTGHHNYGWPVYEGEECLMGAGCQAPDRYRQPVHAYSHNGGSGAVIGGSVYRGSAIPALRGTYIFSDLYGGTRAFRYNGTTDTITMTGVKSIEDQTNAGQSQQTLVAIQNGGDGELYFVGRGGSTDPNGPSVSESVIYKLEAYIP